MAPFLLEDPRVHDMFPADAIARAREYLVHVKGGIGAYSDSKGNQYIRQEVCRPGLADLILPTVALAWSSPQVREQRTVPFMEQES